MSEAEHQRRGESMSPREPFLGCTELLKPNREPHRTVDVPQGDRTVVALGVAYKGHRLLQQSGDGRSREGLCVRELLARHAADVLQLGVWRQAAEVEEELAQARRDRVDPVDQVAKGITVLSARVWGPVCQALGVRLLGAPAVRVRRSKDADAVVQLPAMQRAVAHRFANEVHVRASVDFVKEDVHLLAFPVRQQLLGLAEDTFDVGLGGPAVDVQHAELGPQPRAQKSQHVCLASTALALKDHWHAAPRPYVDRDQLQQSVAGQAEAATKKLLSLCLVSNHACQP
mmetsp:Transcript_107515/g.342830  ORF Transcript_107515/g.342830 Transcript_107515/m.342830 type:complete len:286 (-) Transcript_107515:316-1173(-)